MFIFQILIFWFSTEVLISRAGDDFSEHVFKTIRVQEGTACYRLMNGTNQFGCHATSKNENGILVIIESNDDLQDLKNCYRNRFENYHESFWIMLGTRLMNRETVNILKESNCSAGVVLFEEENELKPTILDSVPGSADSECPNGNTDLYSRDGYCSKKVNENGAVLPVGLKNIDWNIQMVYIRDQKEINDLKRCHLMFNVPKGGATSVTYPFCGMSFKLSNIGAGNSEICFRRGTESAKLFQMNIDSNLPLPLCSPLMGHNVFAWPTPLNNTAKFEKEPNYMIISTRMDSFGLIPEISPGEISVLTSLISVITAAKAIGTNLETWTKASIKSNKFLMFAAFNGESFDYIGSSSAVHKMRNKEFPLPELNLTQLRGISLEQIDYLMEVQQIGSSEQNKIFAHFDWERNEKNGKKLETNEILNEIEKSFETGKYRLERPKKGSRTPPSSWHSFAHFDQNIQSLVLAPFGEKYNYRRYNSILDKNQWSIEDKEKVVDEITAVSGAILAAAGKYVQVSNVSEVVSTVDRQLVSTLFDCLVASPGWFSCDFMQKLDGGRFEINADSYSMVEKSTYVSVAPNNPYRHIVHWLFIFSLGSDKETINVKNKNSCMYLTEHQAVYAYDWQPNPYTGNFSCLRSSTQYILSQSPAFEIEGYNLNNGSVYSTWTESVYSIDSVRLFLIEDKSFDYILMIIALLVSLVSIFIVGRCSEATFIVDEGDQLAERGEPL